MTENTQARSSEELREQLEAAREELRGILAEQGHLDERERAAVKEDHDKRIKAAREGGSIRQALTRKRSKVQEIRERAEELPYLAWSARVRVAELERDHAAALERELEPQVEPAKKAADDHLRDELEPVQAEQAKLRAEHGRISMEANAAFQQHKQAELVLERLLYAGPDDPLRPELAAG